jgi:hypothetical protein
MRKLLLLSLLGILCLAGNAHAQLQKGSRYWGTTVSFNGDNSVTEYPTGGKYKGSLFTVAPSVQTGWFFKDNTMFGIALSSAFTLSQNKNSDFNFAYKSKNNYLAFSLSPYLRHYKSLSPKWAIYLHSGFSLGYSRSTTGINDDIEHYDSYSGTLYAKPGIVFWIKPRFALESDINLLALSAGYAAGDAGQGFSLNAGVTSSLSQYFGVRASWYLQSK